MAQGREHHAVGRHRLGPHVVGQRVVVRHLLPDGRATDVLGVCTSFSGGASGGSLTIERDGHGPVTIAVADIVTGKPVPPRASVRAQVSPRAAAEHALTRWPDLERERLGGWTLRAHRGPCEERANSVLAVGDAGVPIGQAAQYVVDFYLERGQRPLAQVERASDVDEWFTAQGWHPEAGSDVHFLIAAVPRALRAAGRGRDDVHLDDAGQHAVASVGEVARGEGFLDDEWLGLHSVEVDATQRRTGIGTAIVAELLDWGASLGATTVWAEIGTEAEAALGLASSLGFATHHTTRLLAL